MINKLITDLGTSRSHYNIADDLTSHKLSFYYFLFDENRVAAGKDQKLIRQFDENGIPMNSTYIDVTDQKLLYYPISIGQMGLAVFHTWLNSKKDDDKNRFLKFAEWFAANAEITENLGARWLTDVSLPQYHNPGPWQSAFSQARAINILLRGYQLTGNKDWANLAEKALISFTKPVAEGGVTSFTEWGPFYEEYTASIPTLVLNGMIFALFGIYDYVRVFPKNELAARLFSEGIATLKNILPQFNLGYWSRYNLCSAEWYPDIDPATINYQRLHIVQLECLHRITGEKVIKDYNYIYKKQDKFINALRMYHQKIQSLRKIGRL
ncbi:MAG: D-glucuronyl C5-epimerase family protein [Candidatus Cloacimonetes bacterium]|nr:D-glucuronyl C5-epimerase family protein [Candidatus Cloacimonadota bacterium]